MLLKMSKKIEPRQFALMDSGNQGHPNKIPFKCGLFKCDTPSDGSPEGANGKLIRISSEVANKYLQTFVGMAFNINYTDGMSSHDQRFKVAVMERCYMSMDGTAMVEGYIYGKDFPDVVATIRYYNGLAAEYDWEEYRFGASLEMEAVVQIANDNPNVLDVVEFCGTGAAILFAEDAAFKMTSFAASNKNKQTEVSELDAKELKEMLEGFKKDISAAVDGVKTEVGAIKTEIDTLKAAATKPEPTPAPEENAELKAAKERAEKLEKELADLKAAASEPQRKTLSASQLLSKYGKGGAGEDDAKDYQTFCATVDRMNLQAGESLKLKLEAKALYQTQRDGE